MVLLISVVDSSGQYHVAGKQMRRPRLARTNFRNDLCDDILTSFGSINFDHSWQRCFKSASPLPKRSDRVDLGDLSDNWPGPRFIGGRRLYCTLCSRLRELGVALDQCLYRQSTEVERDDKQVLMAMAAEKR